MGKYRQYDQTFIRLAWPLCIQTVYQALFNLIVVFVLGRRADALVGSVNICTVIVNFQLVFFNIVSMGGIVLLSHQFGAGDEIAAANTALISIHLNAAVGATVGILTAVLARPLLEMLNTPPNYLPYALRYIRIVGGFAFLQAAITVISAVICAYGKNKITMSVMLMQCVLQILGIVWGVSDKAASDMTVITIVASAVILAQTISVIVLSCLIVKMIRGIINREKFDAAAVVKKIFLLGSASAGESISYSVSQLFVTSLISSFGATAILARTYVSTLATFVSFPNSAGLALQTMTGRLCGAKKKADAYHVAFRAAGYALAVSTVLAIGLLVARRPIMSIFTSDAKVIDLACRIIFIDLFLEIGRTLGYMTSNALRGTGDVRYPMYVAIIVSWGVGVGCSYLFGMALPFGLVGVWAAFAADEIVRAVLLVFRWRSRKWQRIII